ncbi:MAG TPA: MBL fold metallo-hydrolase [Terriglobales bacterium]|nr:MBL fold metallo-hydrolase [Terriglobales bacterium]
MKRHGLWLSALLIAGFSAGQEQKPAEAPAPATMQVITLGTGFPRPSNERAGPATAVVVKDKVFLVDAGRGVVMRLAATEFPLKSVRAVFLTHLHSDHTSGLPDLFTSTWIFGRRTPLELYGPKGTKQVADALLKFFEEDIHIRRDLTEMQPAEGAKIRTHIVREGVVYRDEDVRVTAFAVDHRPVEHAYGYRFDSAGKSIVISGDTRYSSNLVRFARGADVLVHEVALPEWFDDVDPPQVAARLKAYHTPPEEAGRVAREAGVKMLVLTHLVPADEEDKIRQRAAKEFSGRVEIASDLMRF